MITFRTLIFSFFLLGWTSSPLKAQLTLTPNQIGIQTGTPEAQLDIRSAAATDQRFKKNIQENVPGLSFIESLRPVTYQLDLEALSNYRFQQTGLADTISFRTPSTIRDLRFTGFIAQEVETAAADLGYAFSGIDPPASPDAPYALRYSTFVVPLVKATQEQQEEIEELRSDLQLSQNRYEQLQADYQSLKAQLVALETFVDEVLAEGSRSSSATALQLTPILQQNSPNPFRRETNIEYFVPPGYQTASIHISTVEGKVVRQIELTQSGRSTLHLKTGTFPGGTYQYSLIIDGKLIDTKRMVIVK